MCHIKSNTSDCRQLQRQVYCRGKEDVLQGELGGGGGGLERAGRPSSMRRVILKQRVADTDTSCVKVTVRQYTQVVRRRRSTIPTRTSYLYTAYFHTIAESGHLIIYNQGQLFMQ